jgi:ADP-ribosyl-[dinitrogen reductase] hydrolase
MKPMNRHTTLERAENQSDHNATTNKKRLTVLLVAAAVTIIIIVSLIIGVLLHDRKSQESTGSATAEPSENVIISQATHSESMKTEPPMSPSNVLHIFKTKWRLLLVSAVVVAVLAAAITVLVIYTRPQVVDATATVPVVKDPASKEKNNESEPKSNSQSQKSQKSDYSDLFTVLVAAVCGLVGLAIIGGIGYGIYVIQRYFPPEFTTSPPSTPLALEMGIVGPDDKRTGNLSAEQRLKIIEAKRATFKEKPHAEAFSDQSLPIMSAKYVLEDSGLKEGDLEPKMIPDILDDKIKTGIKDRFYGALLGLAVGDAYGSPYEFKSSEVLKNVVFGDEHKDNGHFSHRKGAWTDDTSMALCMMACLIEQQKYSIECIFERYVHWYKYDYMNFDPIATDFGSTTKKTLGRNMIDVKEKPSYGNAVIMRLAPIVMAFLFSDTEPALRIAASSGGMTAGDRSALDFPAVMAYIMRGFIKGTITRNDVCKPDFLESHLGWYFDKYPYGSNFATVAKNWGKDLPASTPLKDGLEFSSQVVFQRALHAFCTEPSFIDGLAKVIKYGGDTDTIGAVYGQLFGSYYGLHNMAGQTFETMQGGQSVNVNVSGVGETTIFKTTQRVDGITKMIDILWGILTGDDATEARDIMIDEKGIVRDLNPKLLVTGLNVVKDGEKVLSKKPTIGKLVL